MATNAYQRDEDFEVFIEDMGEPTAPEPAAPAVIEKYRGRLPDQLITYWENEGWGAWKEGLFWVVNPDDYATVLEAWIADTPLEGADQWHVIARSAFGRLFVCGEKVGPVVKIEPPYNMISVTADNMKEKSPDELDFEIRFFFSGMEPEYCDDEDTSEKPLFSRALKKLGPLQKNEMYAYDHMLVTGGRPKLDNLIKTDIFEHLLILRDMGGPLAFPFFGYDFDALASEALKE